MNPVDPKRSKLEQEVHDIRGLRSEFQEVSHEVAEIRDKLIGDPMNAKPGLIADVQEIKDTLQKSHENREWRERTIVGTLITSVIGWIATGVVLIIKWSK